MTTKEMVSLGADAMAALGLAGLYCLAGFGAWMDMSIWEIWCALFASFLLTNVMANKFKGKKT